MPSPTFTNDYAPDGQALRAATRAESGHRCIRCGHPYETGLKRADRGEWSDCDKQCTHAGELRFNSKGVTGADYGFPWTYWSNYGKSMSKTPQDLFPQLPLHTVIQARWRILTVHHFDGNKANDAWWNHLALCQRCHLQIQTRVNPEIPWLFEHSDWLKPYVAGFYAKKYLGKDLTRDEVMADLENLLALERLA